MELWDQVLFESSNFVVVPTVGAIIPGWLLLLPRKHFLCVGAMSDALFCELLELRSVAARALRDSFGAVTFFEHGPAAPCTRVGCGVDHAHLHLVATEIDLLRGAAQISQSELDWKAVAGLEATADFHRRKLPYLYVERANGEARIGTSSLIESQLFRRVIAAAHDLGGLFDWKLHPFERNVEDTIDRIERWKHTSSGVEIPHPTRLHV